MSLPPLNALRAFEVAARTGSFAAAARELGVSPAAVGHQVRHLEDVWQRKLFIRQGNRLSLTEAGLGCYPELGEAMAQIERLSGTMRGLTTRSRLVVSAPHSVAETWLPDRLAAWRMAVPDLPVSLRIEDDPVDFARERIHARIFYGHGLYAEHRTEILFQDRLVAIAAPMLAERFGGDLVAFPDRLLVHTDWGAEYASGPNLARLIAGRRPVDMNTGISVPASSLALAAARAGLGAALVPQAMAAPDLAQGRLVQLDAPPVEMSAGYAVAVPHALSDRAAVRQLVAALRGGR